MRQTETAVRGRRASSDRSGSSFFHRWYGKVSLVALSVLALTLSLAPVGQFYLAWVGIVPWLWLVRQSRNDRRAFLWSWVAGTLFFFANMWWLAYVTLPGMLGLMVYLGAYWGVAAIILRRTGLLSADRSAVVSVMGIATVWVGLEWVRGNLFTGLPWLYLGHTQTPVLVVCQIADTLGVQGVSFWVVTLNAIAFLWLITPDRKRIAKAGIVVSAMTGVLLAYGLFRQVETGRVAKAGAMVAVVQPNDPQSNKGEKGATDEERLVFHLDQTRKLVREAPTGIDLVCWSETMLPTINNEYSRKLRELAPSMGERQGEIIGRAAFMESIVSGVSDLAHQYGVNVLTGGVYHAEFDEKHRDFADRRNSAYLFRSDGVYREERYDKIHLVPFGEFMPFRRSRTLHFLYTFFNSFNPYDFDYTLTPGPEDSPTVFQLASRAGGTLRFATPICFEDIDSGLCARLVRGNGAKRADLLVNLTNDGWFRANENAQHLQATIFRSIENRVPLVRSVNTGISAFIDSYGRVTDTIPKQTEGAKVRQVLIDPRYTLFSRLGDWFAMLCAVATGVLAVRGFWRRKKGSASDTELARPSLK